MVFWLKMLANKKRQSSGFNEARLSVERTGITKSRRHSQIHAIISLSLSVDVRLSGALGSEDEKRHPNIEDYLLVIKEPTQVSPTFIPL